MGVRGYTGDSGTNRYGVFSSGNFGGSAGKFFLQPHPTDPSKQVRFACLEGNESGTYCRGTDTLVNGVCTIELPEDFQLASEEENVTAQVTALEGPAMVWVEYQGADRVVVRGTRDVSFNWFVNGVRRGFADIETILPNTTFVPGMDEEFGEPAFPQFRPEYRQLLVENGTLNEDFTPNMETAARLGWIPPTPEPELDPASLRQKRRDSLKAMGILDSEGNITKLGRQALLAKGD